MLNDGSPTRVPVPLQNPSAVDISFCSSSLASLASWTVLPHSFGSDHYPILISFPQLNVDSVILPPLQKYNLHRADWAGFQICLGACVESLPPVGLDNIDSCYDQFVEAIDLAAGRFVPLRRNDRRYRSSPPWWDEDCSQAVKNRRESEARFKTNMSSANFLQFRHTQAKTKRLLLKKRGKAGRTSASLFPHQLPRQSSGQTSNVFGPHFSLIYPNLSVETG